MSMFKRLGEKVERFKQEAVAARDDSTDYRCRNCGEGFYGEQETCPECGSSETEPVTTETAEPDQKSAESTQHSKKADQKSVETADTAESAETDAKPTATESKPADAETDTGADDTDQDPEKIDTVIDEAEPDESDSE